MTIDTSWGRAPRRVYLLGAGFSRGFHPPMPLMADLAKRVIEALTIDPGELNAFNGDLEAWLSYLSTRQPWDDEALALRNLATFREASAAIAEAVRRAASQDGGRPDEGDVLTRLVLDWCVEEADVLTFNYDLLVEEVLRDWVPTVTGPDIYPLPLTERHAAQGGALSGSSEPLAPLPLLYKLHGSVNWLYPGIDRGDGPITLAPWKQVGPLERRRRERHLYADLDPLVVPPTSSKSSFYGNEALRALWHAAADALRTADELVVIGYSFPASDQQVTALIRTTLPPGATIRVVTRDSDVPRRAAGAFQQHDVEELVDEDAAAAYVEQTCGHVIEWSHTSEDPGVREWLSTPNGEATRMANYQDRDLTGDISQHASGELARTWPSVSRTWRRKPFGDDGQRARYQAYVPRAEWIAHPNPWRADG